MATIAVSMVQCSEIEFHNLMNFLIDTALYRKRLYFGSLMNTIRRQ